MGERVSIQFQKLERYGNQDPVKEKSVVLFHHWGAEDFPELALDWVRDFREKAKNQAVSRVSDPISRMEPQTLMVQFIGYLANTGYKSHRYDFALSDSLYLGKDENDGDNSNWGNHLIIIPNESLPFDPRMDHPLYNPKQITVDVKEPIW